MQMILRPVDGTVALTPKSGFDMLLLVGFRTIRNGRAVGDQERSRGGRIAVFGIVAAVVDGRSRGGGGGGPVALDDEKHRHGTRDGKSGEVEPRGDNVAVVDAPGEDGAGGGGPQGAADAAEGGGEAVEGAEDSQGGGRVCEEDGSGGEADDDGGALDEHDDEEGGEAGAGRGEEDAIGGEEVG